MDNEINSEVIGKPTVFTPWVILHTISLLVAFFWCAFLFPYNDEIFQTAESSRPVVDALGGFLAMMFIPWLIALIHRLRKKQPSTSSLFIIYYVILFLWIIYKLTTAIIFYSKVNLDFWSKFVNHNRIVVFFSSLLFLLVFYVLRFLFIKVNKIKSNKLLRLDLNSTISHTSSRKQKEKRSLLTILGVVLFIILLVVIKEL